MKSIALLSIFFAGVVHATPLQKHSETIVPLTPQAQAVAPSLASKLENIPVLEVQPTSYRHCLDTKDGLNTNCLLRSIEGVQTERMIALTLSSEGLLTAFSIRLSDGAAMRFASAIVQSRNPNHIDEATTSIAKTLRGNFGQADIFGLAPLLCLLIGGLLLLLLDAFSQRGTRKDFTAYFTSLIGILTFLLAENAWSQNGFPYTHELFGGMFSIDKFSLFFIMLISGAVTITAPIALGFFKKHGIERGEFYALLVFSAAGMVAMVQSTDLFVIFISLEIMSLAVYILVGFMRHQKQGAEGAMKYFLMGAFSSAFFLYGITLVYGVIGTTRLDLISVLIQEHSILLGNPILLVGVFLVLSGFLFKVSAFPFHMWTPDAYQAAASPVTGFMAFGVKAAAFAAMIRVFGTALLDFRGTGLSAETVKIGWYVIVFFLAATTMVFGNIVAMAQSNLKRMLAYSSIAHAGYLLVGIATMAIEVPTATTETLALATTETFPLVDAGRGMLFYLLGYGFTSLLAFGVLSALEQQGEDSSKLSSLKGLAKRRPALALAMAVAMLSFAGIPPTAGFFGKFLLFREAIGAGNLDLISLTILAMLTSVIGVYYYLRVVVVMYMEDTEQKKIPVAAKQPTALYVAIFAAVAVVIYLGIFPGRYISMSNEAIQDMHETPAAVQLQNDISPSLSPTEP